MMQTPEAPDIAMLIRDGWDGCGAVVYTSASADL